MKKIFLLNKSMFLILLIIFSFSSKASNTAYNNSSNHNDVNQGCRDKIIQLEATISALKERIELLENKNLSSTDNWICIYNGFGQTSADEYSGIGPTRAIASLRAREQCKKNDVNKGLFCKEIRCYK